MEHGTRRQDHYDVLGIDRGATPRQVRSAYRRMVHRTHPDTQGSAASFQRVRRAYEVLSDPVERARYDALTGPADDAAGAFYRRSFDRMITDLFSGLRRVADSYAAPVSAES
jgi:DnaJ-class molecular chaperone